MNTEQKELVDKRLQEFTEYFLDEFDTKIILYRKILEEKSEAATGGFISTALTSSKPALSGGISFGTGIPFLGPAIAGALEAGGKKLASKFEEKDQKNKADSLYDIIFNYKGKVNQIKLRRILIEVCYEIFYSFEKQFMNLTVKNGGETRAMFKLAKDAVTRILGYYINNDAEFIVKDVTKALVYVEPVTIKNFISNIFKSGRTVFYKNGDDLQKWSTKDLFTKIGLQIYNNNKWNFFLKDGCDQKLGYRKLFSEEQLPDNLTQTENELNYEYVLKLENKTEINTKLFETINGRDPNKMEDRIKESLENTKNEMLKIIENIPEKDSYNFDLLEFKEQIKNLDFEILKTYFEENKKNFASAQWDREIKHNETINLIHKQYNLLDSVNSEIKETLSKVDQIHVHIITQSNKPIIFQLSKPSTNFIGRTTELSEIKWIHIDKKIIVLTGQKGVGKTEIALKYAQEFKHDNSNVIWINSETHDSLISSFKDLAIITGIRLEDKTITSIIRETFSYFYNRKTLFIFDNCSDDNLIVNNLQSFINNSNFISILITSVSDKWDFKKLTVTPFSKENAFEYIKTVFKDKPKLTDDESCLKLSEFHNYLPYSLKSSVDYILQQNLLRNELFSIENYIEQFNKNNQVAPVQEQPPPPPPPNDEDLEKNLLEKLERETSKFGKQISAESARAEKRVKKFFKNEVGGFFKKL